MSLATSMMLSVQIARVARGNRLRKSPDQPRLPTDVLSAAWCAGGAGRRVISERPDRVAEILCRIGRLVGETGFEPATPWSRTSIGILGRIGIQWALVRTGATIRTYLLQPIYVIQAVLTQVKGSLVHLCPKTPTGTPLLRAVGHRRRMTSGARRHSDGIGQML